MAKEYVLGVFLNIEEAFHSISYAVIEEVMIKHSVPAALINWTQNMLSDRILIINYDNSTLSGYPAKG